MLAHHRDADAEIGGDGLVRQAVRDGLQDLPLAWRKGAEGLFLFDDLPDLRRDVRPASRDRADR